MPAIKRTTVTDQYAVASRDAREAKEKGHCSPLAVSVLTGVDFNTVNAMMIEEGRKPRMGTHQYVADRVIDRLGFKRVRVDMQAIIKGYPLPHCNVLRNITTHHPRRFPGAFDPSKRYLAHVRGHVLAIVDGQVQDWSINNSLRIYKLEEIVPK